jgi:asparagine synthase (glutamine-hydrolysing)
MCGFAGAFVDPDTVSTAALTDGVERMSSQLTHRGPDDVGSWVASEGDFALGFRRLSIIDLSEHGHQPMRSESGRYTTVFNGEIYNFQDLRHELSKAGHRFRGHSDTEVLLAAFEEWGIRASLNRLIGMFAVAVWDGRERRLHLIRDRLGIKPLLVYRGPGTILFASEMKAILAWPGVDRTLDRDALVSYFRYLYVPGPRTAFARVRKLLPGHLMEVHDAGAELPESQPFWSVEVTARQGLEQRWEGGEGSAIDELEALLLDATRRRMVADVPVGAFLSGGIDSSAVVALMQMASDRPVRTFTIGFEEAGYDEAPHAAAVARHLGTDHTEVMLTPEKVLGLIPRMVDIFDEPFADPSQIPTYLVSEVARREVTVALSGDGGDEVFAGYNRYGYGVPLFQRLLRVPVSARRAAAAGIRRLSPGGWDRVHSTLSPVLPPGFRQRLPGEKLYKMSNLLPADGMADMYRSLLSS